MNLSNVTLLGIDCVNVSRLQKALDISSGSSVFAEVKLLTSLPTDDERKVEIPHLGTIEAYSDFCLRDLYKYVETDFVLLVQHDGFILNPQSWEKEFLSYDYIGAPLYVTEWFIEHFALSQDFLGTWIVGNGGFCIRSKKFLEATARLCENGTIKRVHPEDIAYSVWYRDEMEREGICFAPVELSKKFSIEGNRGVAYEKQFGFHGFKWTDISKWIRENPQWGISQILAKDVPY